MMRWLIAAALLCVCVLAQARDNEAWYASPEEVRRWFQGLMQPDQPFQSCCGEADAYWADSFEVDGDRYVAIITDDRDVPNRQKGESGTRIIVPNHKLKYDAGNPTGHGVIFLQPGTDNVYCYLAPGGV